MTLPFFCFFRGGREGERGRGSTDDDILSKQGLSLLSNQTKLSTEASEVRDHSEEALLGRIMDRERRGGSGLISKKIYRGNGDSYTSFSMPVHPPPPQLVAHPP